MALFFVTTGRTFGLFNQEKPQINIGALNQMKMACPLCSPSQTDSSVSVSRDSDVAMVWGLIPHCGVYLVVHCQSEGIKTAADEMGHRSTVWAAGVVHGE